MPTTQRLSITLSDDLAERVREEVRSGRYASESDVLSEGLRALLDGDASLADWLRDEIVPAYRALLADPDQALTAQQVRSALDAKRGGETGRRG